MPNKSLKNRRGLRSLHSFLLTFVDTVLMALFQTADLELLIWIHPWKQTVQQNLKRLTNL